MLKVLFSRKCRCDVKPSLIIVLVCLSVGWVGVDVKPLQKERSDLAPGQSGTYYQLSDAEQKMCNVQWTRFFAVQERVARTATSCGHSVTQCLL